MSVFTAKFAGSECGACSEQIKVGEQITAATFGYVHADCDDVTPERPVMICPTCHMTSCDCEATS